jgi:hypothetical protein
MPTIFAKDRANTDTLLQVADNGQNIQDALFAAPMKDQALLTAVKSE